MSNNNEGTIQIFGTYMKALWRDELTGFTYFVMSVPEEIQERNKQGMITCTGTIPDYFRLTPICATGIFENTERGMKFKCIRVTEAVDSDVSAIEYLSSGICPGLAQGTAKRIVHKLGKNIFQIMSEPDAVERLMSCGNSMTRDLSSRLVNVVSQTTIQRELFEYVSKFGGHWNSALKLFKALGPQAKKELSEHPFIGIKYGLSFEQCDAIAMYNGMDALDPERICAGALCSLKRAVSSGHEYIYLETLCESTERLLRKGNYKDGHVSASMVGNYIGQCKEIYLEQGLYNKVWLKYLKEAEENTAAQIKRLMRTALKLDYTDDLPDYAAKLCGMSYAPQQKAAFELLKQSGVSILTGGPGTGKTTTVNGLINAYKKMYPDALIRLCAPTGRAAQRMSESTGMEAVTLHKLLDYRPFGDQIACKNADDPIQADLVVVDESSMIDIEIASLFFSALKDGTSVLLVGDIDQLPSVGPGNVLHDMMFSEKIPVCRLTEIYRQSGQSPIVKNAGYINSGDDELETSDDFQTIFCKEEEAMMPAIMKGIQQLYDPENPFKTQVLVPTHKGKAGVAAINKTLQEHLNPKKPGDKELHFGQRSYRIGDKIIMLSNNYEAGYFNGDLGTVIEVAEQSMTVRIMDKEIEIKGDMLNDINLAYAMTIHKSQGSEFENVIISLPFNPSTMLKRNLLYTAVTRAKKRIYIVSENGAIAKSVSSCDTGKRRTDLRFRLKSA